MKVTYKTSPSNGEHWLTEAGDLEPGEGYYHYRGLKPGFTLEKGQDYYSRFSVRLEDAQPALDAAYPDRKYQATQHGSTFCVARAS